jgi:ferredoxin
MIVIHTERCDGCGACIEVCPTSALFLVDGKATLDGTLCRECEACVAACPTQAIALTTPEGVPAAELARVPALRPEPEVIRVRTEPAPVSFSSRVLPVVSAALVWAGREIVPRVADLVLDNLDRRAARQREPVSARAAGPSGRRGKASGRQRRRRRRAGRQ